MLLQPSPKSSDSVSLFYNSKAIFQKEFACSQFLSLKQFPSLKSPLIVLYFCLKSKKLSLIFPKVEVEFYCLSEVRTAVFSSLLLPFLSCDFK